MILKRKEKQAKTPRKLGWVYPFLVVAIAVFVLGLAFSPRPELLYTGRIELRSDRIVENASQAAAQWVDVETVLQAAEATRIVDAGEQDPETIETLRQAVRVRVKNDDGQVIQIQFQHHNQKVATDFLDHLGVIAVANATPGLQNEMETQQTSSNTVEGVFGEQSEQSPPDLAIKRSAFIVSRTGSVSREWLSKVALAGVIVGVFTTLLVQFQSDSSSGLNPQRVAEITGAPVIGSVFPSRTKPQDKSASLPGLARKFVLTGEMILALFLVFVVYNIILDQNFIANFLGEPFSTVAAACDQHLRGIPSSDLVD